MNNVTVKFEEHFGTHHAIITGSKKNRLTIFRQVGSRQGNKKSNSIIFQADYTGKRWKKLVELIAIFKQRGMGMAYINLDEESVDELLNN